MDQTIVPPKMIAFILFFPLSLSEGIWWSHCCVGYTWRGLLQG